MEDGLGRIRVFVDPDLGLDVVMAVPAYLVPHARSTPRIGLKNLAYNMRRLVQLERLAATAPT